MGDTKSSTLCGDDFNIEVVSRYGIKDFKDWENGLIDEGSYLGHLIMLAMKADKKNFLLLERIYPELMDAIRVYKGGYPIV